MAPMDASAQLVRAAPLVLVLVACAGPEPVHVPPFDPVFLHTPDLVSDFAAEAGSWQRDTPYPTLALSFAGLTPRDPEGGLAPWSEAFSARVERAVAEGMSLLRVSDGAVIPADVRRGLWDVTGVERPTADVVFSLVPTEPFESLEDDWYVLLMDLSALDALPEVAVEPQERQARDGRVLYARIYTGSRPMWRHAAVSCRAHDEECRIGVIATEALPVPVEGTVEVRYDGELVPCAPGAASAYGVEVLCPYTQHNEHGGTVIEVDFVSDALLDPRGGPLRPSDGVSARVERAVGYPDPELGLDLVRSGGS